MHKTEDMKSLNTKLDQLKSLFQVGEKIIPGIQNLIDFMVEIVPLLNNINTSIMESTNKIPKATGHLSDVTNATEIATTEILDKVDQITKEVELSEKTHNQFAERYQKMHSLIKKVEESVKDNPEAVALLEEIDDLNGNQEHIKSVKQSFSKINEYLQTITMTLQVQDITAQQLASVNHLILSVQKRLSSLIHDFSGGNVNVNILEQNKNIIIPSEDSFNPDASFTRSDNAQDLVDELINGKTTQEDIDKLFNANGNK